MKLAEATFIGEVADAVWVDWDMGFSESGRRDQPACPEQVGRSERG